jgi:hypothetical protein
VLRGFADDSEVVKVYGSGVGLNKMEALKDAYRDAIERAVGLYVDAEQIVEKEELVKDKIITHSSAYIEKCRIKKQSVDAKGMLSITIIAEVRKTQLLNRIKNVMSPQSQSLTKVNQKLHAQIITEFIVKPRTANGNI